MRHGNIRFKSIRGLHIVYDVFEAVVVCFVTLVLVAAIIVVVSFIFSSD